MCIRDREKDLSLEEYILLAQACGKICRENSVPIILSHFPDAADITGNPYLQLSYPLFIEQPYLAKDVYKRQGYVRFRVHGNSGNKAELSHAEVLDRDGNFYTANLRSAKEKITYILSGEGAEPYHPQFTFQGFRYIRLDSWPCEPSLEDFTCLLYTSAVSSRA